MIGRRALLGGLALAPAAARAQARRPVVGVLSVNPHDRDVTFAAPFRRDMAALGWTDGGNIAIEFLLGDSPARLAELAGGLAARPVDVIVPLGPVAVRAAQSATRTIPIVGMAADMLGLGMVASLARPGGNTTGVSILVTELDAKRLELLHEAVPAARRIGVLADAGVLSSLAEVEAAAARLGVVLRVRQADSAAAIEAALDALLADRVEAVSVHASPILNAYRARLVDRLAAARIPAMFQWPESAEEGAMLGYGPRLAQAYRQIAGLVDKVLRGASPATLPVEQPHRIELVVNLAVARRIGIELPATFLARADTVIE